MPTRVYINYVRQGDVPTAPEVKKILLLADRHLQIKRIVNGQTHITDYDFTASPLTLASIETPNGYADTVYRYMIDETDLHVWIAGVLPADTGMPSPRDQEVVHAERTNLFVARGETARKQKVSGPQPDWIPGALTAADKKARAIRELKFWREQKKEWLRLSLQYADLIPNIVTHFGYWLRSADYVIHEIVNTAASDNPSRYDWEIVAAIIREARKGCISLNPDADNAYNALFFQTCLKSAIADYPNGPDFGALWVRTWGLTRAEDVIRVDNFYNDIIRFHNSADPNYQGRTTPNMPQNYNPTNEYW